MKSQLVLRIIGNSRSSLLVTDMAFNSNKISTKFLMLLIFIDLLFMLAHVLYQLDLVVCPLFSIKSDWGYAEIFQYTKEFGVVLLLFIIAKKHKANIIYVSWGLLFMYLLFDDSLQIHEKFGGHLVNYFGFQSNFGLRAVDFGELGVSVVFATLLFSLIGSAYFFSDCKGKQISRHLFVLVMSLAFFGVLVDTFHRAIVIPWPELIWGLIEDGGEMLIMSIIVWYVFVQGYMVSRRL